MVVYICHVVLKRTGQIRVEASIKYMVSVYLDSCGRGLNRSVKEEMACRILNTERYFRHLQKSLHVPEVFSLYHWDELAFR